MAVITIDVDSTKGVVLLQGSIDELAKNRFAMRYMKDFLNPIFETDTISIPIEDADPSMVLSDVRAMLHKYGFQEQCSNQSNKIIQDFYREEKNFVQFSNLALNIRNNQCEMEGFHNFTTSVATNLSSRSLYPLQLLCAYHLAFSQNACNFSVPGAGKTSIVYGAYAYLKGLSTDDPKRIDKLFIVGPLSSFGPWELEYEECFGKTPSVKRLFSGMSRTDKIDYLHSANTSEITLTSYASLVSLQEALIFYLKYNNVMVVLDEAHKAKNTAGGIIAQAVLTLSKHCKSRVVLTGTPAPNGYEDLYNLFKFIWPTKNIIGYEVNQLRDITSNTRDPRKSNLIENISPYFMRIKKSDLGLPKATVHPPLYIDMGPAQRKIYDFIEKKYIDSMVLEKGVDTFSAFKSSLLKAKTIRLMQAATNPTMLKNPLNEFLGTKENSFEMYQAVSDSEIMREILTYSQFEVPSKYIATKNLVKDILAQGEKVVIWATFIHTILSLQSFLHDDGIQSEILYGGVPVEQEGIKDESEEQLITREKIINEFNNPDCPYKVIIANPFAVSESISLHKACHHAIYIERSFNAAHFVQSKDRIHRFGLKPSDETHYYYILAKNSIDETIDARLKEKELRMTEIMESMPIPLFENIDQNLGNEDIKALIRDYVRRTKKS